MAYKDPEKRRAYGREWMRQNPEKAREAMRRWRERHPEERRARKRVYYASHREQHKAAMAAYHREHPEVVVAKRQRYRARARSAEGSFSAREWYSLVESHGARCGYCGASGPLEADHRIPLARGGANSIDNIIPACASCNRRKQASTEAEFRKRLAQGTLRDA